MAGIKNDVLFGARLGLGAAGTTPSAIAELPAGTATAGTAPLKFTSGTNLTAPEAGVVEYDGTFFYLTNGTLVRKAIVPGGYPITPYVVGPVGSAIYQTIQSALDAANAAGGGAVWVMPGSYTENLTLYPSSQIIGANGNSDVTAVGTDITITGVHIPPVTGLVSVNNVYLLSATDIFNSSAAGAAIIVLENCNVACTNGFTFNLPNWTGALAKFNLQDNSTNNGIVNNIGGATCFFQNSNMGAGSGQTMITSGPTIIRYATISCPYNSGSGTSFDCRYNLFSSPVTFSGNSTGDFDFTDFYGNGAAAIVMSSSGAITIAKGTIETSNNPAIDGAGAGVLSLQGVDFTDSSTIAATVVLSSTGGYFPSGNLGNVTDIWTSNGPGKVPTFQSNGNTLGSGQTIGAVTTDLITLPLGATPGIYTFQIYVSGFESSTPAGVGYQIVGAVRTTGAAAVLVGIPDKILDEEAALVGVSADLVVAGNDAIVRVLGLAGLTINWTAKLSSLKAV